MIQWDRPSGSLIHNYTVFFIFTGSSIILTGSVESTFDGVWANCSLTNWIPKQNLSNISQQIKVISRKQALVFLGSILGNFSGWEIDEKYDTLPRYNTHWLLQELHQEIDMLGECIYERKIPTEKSKRKDYYNIIPILYWEDTS